MRSLSRVRAMLPLTSSNPVNSADPAHRTQTLRIHTAKAILSASAI